MYLLLLGLEHHLDVRDAGLEEVKGLLDLVVAPDHHLARCVPRDEVA